jgi:hypothetical protein
MQNTLMVRQDEPKRVDVGHATGSERHTFVSFTLSGKRAAAVAATPGPAMTVATGCTCCREDLTQLPAGTSSLLEGDRALLFTYPSSDV